jgi:hypothetical protein
VSPPVYWIQAGLAAESLGVLGRKYHPEAVSQIVPRCAPPVLAIPKYVPLGAKSTSRSGWGNFAEHAYVR